MLASMYFTICILGHSSGINNAHEILDLVILSIQHALWPFFVPNIHGDQIFFGKARSYKQETNLNLDPNNPMTHTDDTYICNKELAKALKTYIMLYNFQ